ncbi:Uncharacterized protein SCF082_LOCUS10324 [Durusdinium trenchii]|uniref:Uncharacterized protein n=1 Tax=Durusdinium trenchii TaxID=1381693 RepID=A0ABP0J5C4_9DINO
MVIPMGPGMLAQGVVPDVLREKYAKLWWTLGGLCLVIAVLEVVGRDFIAMLFYGMMTGIMWYMVKDQCKNMTMYCLLVTGLVGSIQAVFDLLRLLTSMGGRRTSSTAIKPGSTSDTTTYTTEVTVHPFFDQDLGLAYNVQSTLIIACPIASSFAIHYICLDSAICQ